MNTELIQFTCGLAFVILSGMLFRFFKTHLSPAIRAGNWRRTVLGSTVVVASIVCGAWFR